MTDRIRRLPALAFVAAALALTPLYGSAQTNATKSPEPISRDRWLHVRVENPDTKDESVRVNIPLELAEKILPTINHDRLQSGKVKVNEIDCHGVDLPALLDAVRTSKDGEFVTVQNKDSEVRVAKQNNYFLIHVVDKNHNGDKNHTSKRSAVEVKIPMKVVDALFSGRKDELDLVAGLHALSAQGDTELVSVRDDENTVRVWLDSKNASD
jgi:ABC-type oligopeptide transport system substrate-binding subunit